MKTIAVMKTIPLMVGLAFSAAWTLVLPAAADDLAEIKKLVPAAAAMTLGDLDKLATSRIAPKSTDVKSKTLTLMLLALKVRPDDEKAHAEFSYLGDVILKPQDIVGEMTRSVRGSGRFRIALGPVTMIQADRITNWTCTIDGDVAKGKVSFKVPELYQGRVDYVARRREGEWRIEEFMMPANGVHIALADDDTWIQK